MHGALESWKSWTETSTPDIIGMRENHIGLGDWSAERGEERAVAMYAQAARIPQQEYRIAVVLA